MNGQRARERRRAEGAKPRKPIEVTHPINPDLPSRKQRRETLRNFRANMTRRSARLRNVEAKRRGVPTPAESIRAAIKRAGIRYVNDPQGWRLFAPKPRKSKAWQRWRPS